MKASQIMFVRKIFGLPNEDDLMKVDRNGAPLERQW